MIFMTNPLEAVDVCFKLFWALNIEYSLACPHIWIYFLRNIFIKKEGRKIIALNKILELEKQIEKTFKNDLDP